METKILRVFYGNDALPYKDKELSVHFPIVGSAFLGASNTTEIRFYFSKLGTSNNTWVSVAKLPNGKQGSRVLELSEDEYGEYAILQLSNWYTQAKGDVFIALQGYDGLVYTEVDEYGLYEIHGEPTVQTTGSIKLAINYAPIGQVPDYRDEFTEYHDILSGLGGKLNVVNGIVAFEDISSEDVATYENGQMLYDKLTRQFYIVDDEVDNGYKKWEKVIYITSNETGGTLSLEDTQALLEGCEGYIIVLKTSEEEGTVFFYAGESGGEKQFRAIQSVLGRWGGNNHYYVQTTYREIDLYYSDRYDWVLLEWTTEIALDSTIVITSFNALTQTDINKIKNFPSYIVYKSGNVYQIYEHIKTDGELVFESVINMSQGQYFYKLEKNELHINAITGFISRSLRSVNIYTTSQADALLDAKADKSDTYTKAQVDSAISSAVSSAYKYKGSVATYEDLPSSGNVVGDVWNVESTGNNYAWTGTTWDALGGIADLSNYYTKGETDTLLNAKANASSVYTKTETDTLLGAKADTSDVYAKSEVYTKSEVNTELAKKVSYLNYSSGTTSLADIYDDIGEKVAILTLVDTPYIVSLHLDSTTYSGYFRGVGANNKHIYRFTGQAGGQTISNLINDTFLQDYALVSDITAMQEKIEGKCKSISIAYTRTAPTTDAQATILKKLDGTYFTDLQDFEDYVYDDGNTESGVCINSLFNSQNLYIEIDEAYYYLITNDNFVLRWSDTSSSGEPFNLNNGDIIWVINLDVPDRWYNVDFAYALETTKVDLTNYYAKNNDLLPSTTNTYDIGSSTYKYKDGYFSGQVYAENTFNVINASDIVSNTLTQAQYDLITNGKPTLIKGTLLNYKDMLLPTFNVSGTSTVRVYFACANELIAVALNPTTKVLSLVGSSSQIAGLRSVYSINGKQIPAYPPNTGTFVLKCIDGVLTWVQES